MASLSSLLSLGILLIQIQKKTFSMISTFFAKGSPVLKNEIVLIF